MHSSRMCTVRTVRRSGCLRGVSVHGGVCPGWGVCLGGCLPRGRVSAQTPPPVNRITDRCKKHYLSASAVVDGNESVIYCTALITRSYIYTLFKSSTQHPYHTSLMAHSHRTGPGQGQGLGKDRFLHYSMYCTHYTGTGIENHCFLLCPSRSLSMSRSSAVCMSH